MSSATLSVVVPAYNEGEGIEDFIRSVGSISWDPDLLEIIVVDDGSTDGTAKLVETIASKDHRVKLIQLSTNSGHMAAITAGLMHAAGDWVVTIDSDGQDDPALIPKMYNACIASQADICYMQRKNRRQDPLRHRIFSPIFYTITSSFTRGRAPYQAADFRLISKRVVGVLNSLPEVNRVYRILIPSLGFKSTSLEYDRKFRQKGVSKYGFSQLAKLGLKSMLATSGAPLRWVSIFSLMGAVFGLTVSAIAFISGVIDSSIPGWSSIAFLVSALFTFQAITSLVICEFLLVIIADLRRRPQFQVKNNG
jgi:glycosyltransferase involved in cell wall biosynthesis